MEHSRDDPGGSHDRPSTRTARVVRIGEWLVDPWSRRLHNGRSTSELEPRLIEVLLHLAARAPEVVPAEELLREIWKGTFYGDGPVQRAISLLRKALGDDATTPCYIETIRKRGYRMIASIVWPEDYALQPRVPAERLHLESPYVGLRPFGAGHAGVFFGRDTARGQVLRALQRQRTARCPFVLLLGASGSGKTSLVDAGIMPLLLREDGFDDMRVVSHAHVDLRGCTGARALSAIAAGLSRLEVGGWPVFPGLDEAGLIERIESDAVASPLRFALERARQACRQASCLFALTIDHAEALASDAPGAGLDSTSARRVRDCLSMLLRGEDMLIVITCRRACYPGLVEALPDIVHWAQPAGRVELMPPSKGEIAQMIRTPAKLMGLRFEADPHTGLRLDDMLRDRFAEDGSALPLLQHALQLLYREGSADGYLRFSTYEGFGGIEGLMAELAERAVAACRTAVQLRVPALIEKLAVDRQGSDPGAARPVRWDMLKEPEERELAATLVDASVLVADLVGDVAHVAVAHRGLLDAWPRARRWLGRNAKWLMVRVHIARDYERWVQSGHHRDLLLRRGLPMDEALWLSRDLRFTLPDTHRHYIGASRDAVRSERRWSMLKSALLVCAVASAVIAYGTDERAGRNAVLCAAVVPAP